MSELTRPVSMHYSGLFDRSRTDAALMAALSGVEGRAAAAEKMPLSSYETPEQRRIHRIEAAIEASEFLPGETPEKRRTRLIDKIVAAERRAKSDAAKAEAGRVELLEPKVVRPVRVKSRFAP